MTPDVIEDQIRTAFADVPPPPSWALSGSQEGTEPLQVAEAFKDKHDWRDLSPEFLDTAPNGLASALSFLSAEAFRFYLPAYLIADLHGRLESVDVLFHLTHGLDDSSKTTPLNPRRYGARTWYDAASYKHSVFSALQARVIIAFIEFKSALLSEEGFDIATYEQAVLNFWLPRATA